MKFLSTSADIAIGGGAAGVGKTYSLLLENLRHKHVPGFGAVCFRRTSPQIKAEGALWDTSMSIYKAAGGTPRESSLEWDFGASKIKFSHLEYEKNIYDWQGAQIPLIEFDELTHFSKKMFFYLLSRNRSVCGVKPYVRATCNPDPDSWLAEYIGWWIDPETGDPIPERDGVLRYMIVDGENIIWGDTKAEVIEKGWHLLEDEVTKSGLDPEDFVKSVTFISGSIYDNRELLRVDKGYLGNLKAQDEETQSALLRGNWKTVLSDKDLYHHGAFSGMFSNSIDVATGHKFITADVALEGADKFIIGVWDGRLLIDGAVIAKSKGNQVVDAIKALAREHFVQNRHICYDADGVGGFIDGFIEGAIPFHNGGSPMPNPDLKPGQKGYGEPEKYEHLKAQCYYRSAKKVNEGLYAVSPVFADKMYDDKMTVKQRFMFERKAIKKAKQDQDGKLCIVKKGEMKAKLNGQSPDMMDMFMMRERFDLEKTNDVFFF